MIININDIRLRLLVISIIGFFLVAPASIATANSGHDQQTPQQASLNPKTTSFGNEHLAEREEGEIAHGEDYDALRRACRC